MESVRARVFRFGAFELDVRAGELRKHDIRIRLQEQPLRILLMLLENPGEVVLREEIRKRLWPNDTIVEFDHSINAAIKRLRYTLGDAADRPHYVETVERRGYRFIETVEAVPAESDGVGSKTRWKRLVMITLATTGLGTGAYLWLHSAPKLTDKDTIVLADFVNRTSDPVFDETLRQGLAVQLEQSPFLSLVSEGRIRQTLQLMGQRTDAKLTQKIALDLCKRLGSEAVVDGSIANLGSQFVLGIRAVNCYTGDSIAQVQRTARTKERVLNALSEAAAKLRSKLGESLKTIHKLNTPLWEATTPSLEALQAFTRGQRMQQTDQIGANSFYKQAIALDPNFAMAHAMLGVAYYNLGENGLAAESCRRAYDLRGRVSERERLEIESDRGIFTGDLERDLQILELWAQTYPRAVSPRNNAGVSYNLLGQHEKAIATKLEAFRLAPNSPLIRSGLVLSYIFANRLDEALRLAQETQIKSMDSAHLSGNLYMIAFLRNDKPGMAEQLTWSVGKPQIENQLLYWEAETAGYSGHLRAAREFTHRARFAAERDGEKEVAAGCEAANALREALFGNSSQARERVAIAMRLLASRDVQFAAALVHALVGETSKALSLADTLAKAFPEDTCVRFNFLPVIRAQLDLNHKNPARAIKVLDDSTRYELGSPGSGSLQISLYPVYLRGEACLAARRGREAAVEFQKILSHPGVVQNGPIGALAHIGLGRAYMLAGDKPRARTAYENFLTLWKDADSDVPILRAAKAEYAKLRKGP